MRIAGFLVLAVAGLVGCVQHRETTIHGDVTFTAEERASVERGAAFISARTPDEGAVVVLWDAPHVDGPCEGDTIQRSAGGTGGVTSESCIVLGLQDPHGTLALDALAAHELGHWRGMGHVIRGLMQPLDMPLAWSDEDQAECLSRGACR